MKQQLHFGVMALHAGGYVSSWRAPESDPYAFADINHYVRTAQIAEAGAFDAFFLADQLAVPDPGQRRYKGFSSLEPTIVLAIVAAATQRIGLVATASTTYNEPFNIARRFATLDHVSGGRAGWNAVTTADVESSRNFGSAKLAGDIDRYPRAREFLDVVRKLWDSWEDDAFVGDKVSGDFLDEGKVHAIGHKGRFYTVDGPLNVPRTPQGRPVIFQAGGSGEGRELAAQAADCVFTLAQTQADSLAYIKDLRERTLRNGRSPNSIRVLPGLVTVIGDTEEAAWRRHNDLLDQVPFEYGLSRLAWTLELPAESLKLDERLPTDLLDPRHTSNTMFQAALDLARNEDLTVRQLIRRMGSGWGHRLIVGTPEQIADDIERWFRSGAADGFTLLPDVLPMGLAHFVDGVIPLLRGRGLFRDGYQGRTLRDHLGLPRAEWLPRNTADRPETAVATSNARH